MGKVFKIAYIVLIVVFLVAWRKTSKLPTPELMHPELWQAPQQNYHTASTSLELSYRDREYIVEPLADYEIWGLVVSRNNINAWYNYYHDENSVNLKDVCVVWGDNIKNGAYLQDNLKFYSGEWTCYYRWQGYLNKPFDPRQLSNNHLLAQDVAIQKIIRQVNVGDQIHLQGALVDYREKGETWKRQTSISRTDENSTSRSGGACEIILVEKIDILARHQLWWNRIYDQKGKILGAVIMLNLLWFVWPGHQRHRIKPKRLEPTLTAK